MGVLFCIRRPRRIVVGQASWGAARAYTVKAITSVFPNNPDIPVVPETTPARSKVARLIPRNRAHSTAVEVRVIIKNPAGPVAVVTMPDDVSRLDRYRQTLLALLFPPMAAFRAKRFLRTGTAMP